MRLLFFLLWFLAISAAVFVLPAYDGGDLGEEKKFLVPVYAVIAGLAAIGVRGRAESRRESLIVGAARPRPARRSSGLGILRK